MADNSNGNDGLGSQAEAVSAATFSCSRTEKEKMMAGELYDAFDPVLLAERNRVKHLCFQLNQTSPLDVDKRKSITKDIVGRDDALIESPFHCDYGYNLVLGKNCKLFDCCATHDRIMNILALWLFANVAQIILKASILLPVYSNHGCTILDCNRITIGDNCMLAPHVVISAATHPLEAHRREAGEELTAPITIGNNVWIGANVTIIPNVTIGNGVVIGAGAVVTKSFPDNVVIAGVPAKIIRYINENDDNADDRRK
jgi:maltose O-acetyltransferase